MLLDQRNCGRSTPHAGDLTTNLSTNTTWALVADLERLRDHLGIDRWQVFGGSWGSTLALAYAETHPERVSELIVRGGGRSSRRSSTGTTREGPASSSPTSGRATSPCPKPSARPAACSTATRAPGRPDPHVYGPAALAWSRSSASTITVVPRPELVERYSADPASAVASARIENHYIVNAGWFEPDQLIRDVDRLSDIPTAIVQGRYDMCTPVMSAWRLHKALPHAELDLVHDSGHAFDEPGILAALVAATNRYADR